MADIKWIKITTDIFDDEKLKIIDTMPARDEIIVIWFKLLSLAGKVNQNGLLFMNSKIAYTPEMLSAIFNRELNTVRLALNTFEQFGMITTEDNEVIAISNWEKHQNIDGMDKIREQNKIRQQKHREKQKQLTNSNVTVTLSNAIDKEKDKDKEKIKDYTIEVIEYLNTATGKNFKSTTKATKEHINARLTEGYTIDDFKAVIDIKTKQWKNDKKYSAYLRPQTLFSPKFESYINEAPVVTKPIVIQPIEYEEIG